jgi:hypothetical protein
MQPPIQLLCCAKVCSQLQLQQLQMGRQGNGHMHQRLAMLNAQVLRLTHDTVHAGSSHTRGVSNIQQPQLVRSKCVADIEALGYAHGAGVNTLERLQLSCKQTCIAKKMD